jgi:hypothetical protein
VPEIVIEIGEAEAATGLPARRRWGGNRLRLGGMMALALLVMTGAVGGQPAPQEPFSLLATVAEGDGPLAVAGELVLSYANGTVRAYEAEGALRWSAPGGSGTRLTDLRRHGDLVVFSEDTGGEKDAGGDDKDTGGEWTTTAADLATGAVKWQLRGRPVFAGDYYYLPPGFERGFSVFLKHHLDLSWTMGAGQAVGLSPDLGAVFTVDGAGDRLTEWDAISGLAVRSVALGLAAPRKSLPGLRVMERSIRVEHESGQVIWLDRATLAIIAEPGEQVLQRRRCGPVECVQKADLSWSFRSVETSRELWQSAGQETLIRTPGGPAFTGERGFDLADPMTGERQLLAGWEPILTDSLTAEFALRATEANTAVIRLTETGTRFVGVLPAGVTGCRQQGRLIACELDGYTGIWRLTT